MSGGLSYRLDELAQRFALELRGNGATRIHGVGTLASANGEQLSFLANPVYRRDLAASQADQQARLRAAQAKGDEIEIIVSDNGNGMDAMTRAALLEGGQGGGLGLPLAKQLVESHGGTFTLESEPDHGTTIIIALPAG